MQKAFMHRSNGVIGACFSDIDYVSDRSALWPTAKHLKKLKNLISAYGKTRLETDDAARETVLALLDHWLEKDFKCSTNRYPQEISTPRDLAVCSLMLFPYHGEERLEKIDKIVRSGTLRGSSKAAKYTGANLMDMMENTLYHSFLLEDHNLALAVADEEKGVGALYMELINDGITGKLSFITFDDILIALGAGLDLSKSSSKEIRTTVDQSKYNAASVGTLPIAVGTGAVTAEDTVKT